MNQTAFFEAVGDALQEAGHEIAFLCFHERSHEYLRPRGKRSFNAFASRLEHVDSVDLARYSWPSLNLVLSHEKAAFEVSDSRALSSKLRRYLHASESALESLGQDSAKTITLVQELGGFLSNIAAFYAARRRGLDNVFIEPSFFRGRVFFVRNSFAACAVPGPRSPDVSAEVAGYLEAAVVSKQAVIPAKDKHHYRGPMSKLSDLRHVRRLAEKTLDKYLLGKSEEFGHIGGHVARHLRMLLNHYRLSPRYRALSAEVERYVYYPLHVPADVALTIRAPQYVDQYALIDFVARTVPDGYRVLIKEHPALVGAVNRRRMVDLLKSRDNVTLLHPHTNNYEVMSRAAAVITVNSKSGAEALLLGRPTLVLGDAFYYQCDLAFRVESLGELPETLSMVLRAPPTVERRAIHRYFQDVWNSSWPGELYDSQTPNARKFASSLMQYLETAAGRD
jgi:hypothetical protein